VSSSLRANTKQGREQGWTHLLEQTHEDIGSERPLVSLIEDDGRVPGKHVVVHGLSKKHTVGHVLEERRVSIRHVLESNRVSDLLSEGDWW